MIIIMSLLILAIPFALIMIFLEVFEFDVTKNSREHKHNFKEWEGDSYRVTIFKTASCECGATRMLTQYGWRVYKDGSIIAEGDKCFK